MSRHVGLVVGVATVVLSLAVHAADQPLPGKRLALERSASRESLALVIADPGIVVPPAGSADDPAISAGLRVQLFAGASLSGAELVAPAGLGKPGWTVKSGAVTRYGYVNPAAPGGASPIRSIKITPGKGITIVARATGLALAAAEGSIGVRIEMGGTRLCALFDGAAVRRDVAGKFIARSADAPGLSACTDEGLYGIPCESSLTTCDGLCSSGAECGGTPGIACECVSPDQGCGATDPVCNGECPAGEVCSSIGGLPVPSCACLPQGSTPCGDVHPSCGDGGCPAGTDCYPTSFVFGGDVLIEACECRSEPPPLPCGGSCPDGWQCIGGPGIPVPFCLPPFCSGGNAAVCDGSCAAPGTCQSGAGLCLCLEPCSGGSPYPTCGGTCTTPGTTCRDTSVTGTCVCLEG